MKKGQKVYALDCENIPVKCKILEITYEIDDIIRYRVQTKDRWVFTRFKVWETLEDLVKWHEDVSNEVKTIISQDK